MKVIRGVDILREFTFGVTQKTSQDQSRITHLKRRRASKYRARAGGCRDRNALDRLLPPNQRTITNLVMDWN